MTFSNRLAPRSTTFNARPVASATRRARPSRRSVLRTWPSKRSVLRTWPSRRSVLRTGLFRRSALVAALVAAVLLGPLTGVALDPIVASLAGGPILHAQVPSATGDTAASDSLYEYGARTRDGTGKYYMGREISLVMGHQGAGWLERPERERQERTDLFIERIPVEPDDVVADIGAGTGYFAFPIAERLPEGRMLAVDIQPEMLSIIEERKRELGVDNVETIRGTVTDPGLPEGAVDLIYIVDAYHEFSHPREMGEAMFDALKPGGRIVLVEYRAEDPTVPIKPLHKMSEEQAREEMAALGLEWVRTDDYLPQQHVLIFERP